MAKVLRATVGLTSASHLSSQCPNSSTDGSTAPAAHIWALCSAPSPLNVLDGLSVAPEAVVVRARQARQTPGLTSVTVPAPQDRSCLGIGAPGRRLPSGSLVLADGVPKQDGDRGGVAVLHLGQESVEPNER